MPTEARQSLKLFKTKIPQANQYASAAEYGQRMTLLQKWGYQGLAGNFRALTQEIVSVLEG